MIETFLSIKLKRHGFIYLYSDHLLETTLTDTYNSILRKRRLLYKQYGKGYSIDSPNLMLLGKLRLLKQEWIKKYEMVEYEE